MAVVRNLRARRRVGGRLRGRFTRALLELAGEKEGHIVGLLSIADPLLQGFESAFGEQRKRQLAVLLNVVEQALLSELFGAVLRLGQAIGEGDEEIAGLELHDGFTVCEVIEESDYGAATAEALDGAGAGQEEGWEMAPIGIGKLAAGLVVASDEERGIPCRLRASVEVLVDLLEKTSGRE